VNPELEEQLRAAFPQLYHTEKGFYFECGDGWFTLLWHLSERLQDMIVHVPPPEQGEYYARQVKQKFGELRFYLSNSTDEMFQATEAALEESKQICEVCGASGHLLLDLGYLMTRCPTHTPPLC
jgi:hypothetical protein